MKNKKNVILISIFSIIPCVLYALMMGSDYNAYLYTSIAKFVMFFGFPFLYFKFANEDGLKKLISYGSNRKQMKLPIILGSVCLIGVIAGFIVMRGLFDKQMILNGLLNEGITKSTYPFVFLHIVFVNAFLEELFFRGFIFLSLYKLGYRVYAYAFSSILFSVYHMSMFNTWFSPMMFAVCILGLILTGVIFSEVDRRAGNIYASYFIHLGANIGINIIGAYLFLS